MTGSERNDLARDEYEARIAKLEAERDEADRRAGAAEREMDGLKDDARKQSSWFAAQKEARGYGRNVSFDRVWKEACALADRAQTAEAQRDEALEALKPFADRWASLRDPIPQGQFAIFVDANACARAALIRNENQIASREPSVGGK